MKRFSPSSTSLRSVPAFDAAAIEGVIESALASAGIDTRSGPMKGLGDTLRQALSGAGPGAAPARPRRPMRGQVIDVLARVVSQTADRPSDRSAGAPSLAEAPVGAGEFATRSFTGPAGTRSYKLYVPTTWRADVTPGERPPLVVMLHGCTQNPDDFAAGTRMNELAERHGFLVAYPAQASDANGSKCWNWFKAENQTRDRGEPSLIAGITRDVTAACGVDERRVFVAGLSAGAAMAVVLGRVYPELYAAVGAHSGLPYAAAHDMPSAFAAMRGGAGLPGMAGLQPQVRDEQPTHRVPTIVFHGAHDATVDPANGERIALQAVAAADGPRLRQSVQRGSGGGRSWRRTVHADTTGRPVVEQWLLDGAGHAWSGGSAGGSYTDPAGPDASAEMLRFFLEQLPAGTA